MAEISLRGMTVTVEQKLITETCCNCGVLFAITDDFKREKMRDRGTQNAWFYCPNGHSQYYGGEREEDKLRRERDRLKQQLAQKDDAIRDAQRYEQEARDEAEHQRRRANGYKGHATRITKRAKAGVCPCCNRTFKQLAAHMKAKHPQFTPDVPEPLRLAVDNG